MDEIATKLLQTTNDPHNYATTLTITGAPGFGKTTAAISLCHHPDIKKYFTDGFLFIELGPQATDPSIKLTRCYHLLTGEEIKRGDINHAEQEIKNLTCNYYRNLLVIIDDVWHVEDAEPLVKAFSCCKTILTTRMNDIEQYIPSKQSVTVGKMTQSEAISLLTSGIIYGSQLSQEDVRLLNELAEDVFLWPLLLSLIRGQLSYNFKKYSPLPFYKAIQNVKTKLHHNGLIACDKNQIESSNKSKICRKFAVKACIEVSLELLTKPLSNRIKTLILWTGIGASLQMAVLNNLWNTSKQEAEDSIDVLWNYGLVKFTDSTILSTKKITQHYVEVHSVISWHILNNMNSNEVLFLSPCGTINTVQSVLEGLTFLNEQLHEVKNPSLLSAIDYLKLRLNDIENIRLQIYVNSINMFAVNDPHVVMAVLEKIKYTSKYASSLLSDEIDSLISECKQLLKDAHKVCRKTNQTVQKLLHEKNYNGLIQVLKEFISHYPLCDIAQKAITMVKKLIPHCDSKLQVYIKMNSVEFQRRTFDNHFITLLIIPYIQLDIKLCNRINFSFLNGSPHIEHTYNYIMSHKFKEEYELVDNIYCIKLQEVAPYSLQLRTLI